VLLSPVSASLVCHCLSGSTSFTGMAGMLLSNVPAQVHGRPAVCTTDGKHRTSCCALAT